jgi:hypothetical protein
MEIFIFRNTTGDAGNEVLYMLHDVEKKKS